MIRGLLSALLWLAVLGMPLPAHAQQAQGRAGPSPEEAQRVIDLLQDPQQRAQLIAALQAIATAAPGPAPAQPAEKPAAKPAPAVRLAPHSLGAQLLGRLSRGGNALAGQAASAVRTVTDFPALWHWAHGLAVNPAWRAAIFGALWRAVAVLACALVLEWLAFLLMARPVAVLAAHAPPRDGRDDRPQTAAETRGNGAWRLLRRLPLALGRLALDLVPVGVFWGGASLLAGFAPDPMARTAILIVVNAYAITRVVLSLGRMLASPTLARLRLLEIDEDQARYLMAWLRRIAGVAVFGSAGVQLAVLFGLFAEAAATLTRFVALVVAILLAILVLRCRRTIADRLRAEPGEAGGVDRWRNGVAAIWHYLALVAIVAGWIVWTAGAENEAGGLRLLLGSVAIIVAARLVAIVALGSLDRAFRLSLAAGPAAPPGGSRATRYEPAARRIVGALIAAATAVVVLQWWGADAFHWFVRGTIGARLISAMVTVALAAIAAIVVWEIANARLERRLAQLSAAGPEHAARLRTLLPLLRAALLVAVLAVVGLTALSEIGIDIAPLLAGAGIVGIAVGFGAQKLVQDVITGMFVLLENAIQIGDTVTVAGLTGTVERLSVRNIWLRGGDAAVHVVPFSAVSSITNSNRGLGNAAISVTVAYDEDADRVSKVLREIAGEMRDDPAFSALMLGDLQIWVDAVRAWGVTLAGQIVCTDAGRWPVQREFNRRLQRRFQELGIRLSDWYGAAAAKPV